MIWGKKDERRLRAVSEETKTACQGEKPGPRASAEKGDCFHSPVGVTMGWGRGWPWALWEHREKRKRGGGVWVEEGKRKNNNNSR